MKRDDETVLVTGAAGFIGSHVAARLAAMGWRVAACDNFNDYYSPRLKADRVEALLRLHGIACERVELSDRAQVDELFHRTRPSHVVHLAAQAGVRHSLENPAAYIESNLVAFSHVLEGCRRWCPRHLVYASSSSVYGASHDVPFREDHMTDQPVSLYAATKKSNELLAYCYSHLFGLRMTGLRFFTVYGPWGRPDMAYFNFTRKMLKREPIPVFAQGLLSRDFTYIDDIVEGVVRVLTGPPADVEGAAHTVLNIGSHQPVQVIDFIAKLEKVLGVKAELEFLPMQPGDVPATYADTSRLQQMVGFTPSTSLEEGLTRFRDWFVEWSNLQFDVETRLAAKGCGPHASA
ncbi:NAD-dependent epimerase/dehydratase family protein [Noviherbaspirillum malthae]|uniref:NAD-dependent epimerase/dehydratase family protein n=1 Tax=Noviherbaspirillum malthae TaxID=1260987 RepID=UPI00188E05A7|nr:NAD-dependent epimerase/dehydratase family protein [Noviherbaspirillum malthae]